jgi:hypothetical protein
MKKLKLNLYLCLVFLILTPSAYAQDAVRTEYQITTDYKAGEFLIYDCRREFFACVDLESNEACLLKRNESIKLAEKKYPCAPLRKFKEKRECVLRNYTAIETARLKRFCFAKN